MLTNFIIINTMVIIFMNTTVINIINTMVIIIINTAVITMVFELVPKKGAKPRPRPKSMILVFYHAVSS